MHIFISSFAYMLVSKTGVNSQKLYAHGVNCIIVWKSTLVIGYKQNSLHFLEVKAISKPLKKGCILFPLDCCAGFG